MKRISTYIATLVLALAGSSCSDYLDKEYDASLSEKKVFNNQNLTREFLANIYTNLPDGLAPLSDDQFTGASRDCMTDNAVTCWGLHYYTKIGSDGYTAGDHPLLGFWNTDLYGIRKCNMFLKNAKASVVGNTEKDGDDNRLYDRYCAEARLLRAIFHFDLICWFGAAPVIAEDESGEPIIFDLSDPSAMNMFRTPAAEALEWVADQCDQIKNQLPFRYSDEASNWGRVNGAAAYALKARALLYRASKLNNPDGNTAYWANAAQAADIADTAGATGEIAQSYEIQQLIGLVFRYGCFGAVWSLVGMLLSLWTFNRMMAWIGPFIVDYLLEIVYERYFDALKLLYPKEWLVMSWSWPLKDWGICLWLLLLAGMIALIVRRTGMRCLERVV